MVFQSYAIWPHMTVFDNVAYPLDAARRPARATIRERVTRVLDLVGLAGLETRSATLLSGGQMQRLALCRALVYEPDLLLLDEPFSNLDAKLREQMRVELKLLQRRLGITVLFVTHDQIEALSLSDRIAVMQRGRVEQVGAPREPLRASRLRLRARLPGPDGDPARPGRGGGRASRARRGGDGRPAGRRTLAGRLGVARRAGAGRPVHVAIRPEDIEVVADAARPSDGATRCPA